MVHPIVRLWFSLLAVLPLLGLSASAALVAPPTNVHIEVPEQIGVNGDPFTASGDAVAAGLLCASGTVDDLSVVVMGSTSGPYRTILAHKRFYCGDASGTFDVKMVVRLNSTSLETTAQWRFAGGTGAYSGIHGQGSLAGTPIMANVSVYDVYDGRLN